MNCENCGIPEGSYTAPGYRITPQFMPRVGEKWTRQQKHSVWVCGSACAVQIMAIAAMGFPSHKWPMTLAEFTSQMEASGRLDFLKGQTGQTVTKPPLQVVENLNSCEAKKSNLIPQHVEEGFVTQNRGGRPRTHRSNAARQRAYRTRNPE